MSLLLLLMNRRCLVLWFLHSFSFAFTFSSYNAYAALCRCHCEHSSKFQGVNVNLCVCGCSCVFRNLENFMCHAMERSIFLFDEICAECTLYTVRTFQSCVKWSLSFVFVSQNIMRVQWTMKWCPVIYCSNLFRIKWKLINYACLSIACDMCLCRDIAYISVPANPHSARKKNKRHQWQCENDKKKET